MDLGTGLALFGTAKLAVKLLGPTAEYLGTGLKDYTQKAVSNLNNIFSSAVRKVQDLNDGRQVAPRTLKNVLSEGAFCEDQLSAEYFGGVLASSRSPSGRDDRGASWTALLGRLSTYQIRTHYVIYSAISHIFAGGEYRFNMDDRDKLGVFIPFSAYFSAMDFSKDEMNQTVQLLNHSLFGLNKEDLIDDFLYGPPDRIKKRLTDNPLIMEGGILATPSALGAELYLWVHGYSQLALSDLTKTDFPALEGAPPPVVAHAQEELRKKPEKKNEEGR